jgi:hypothetical protein
MKKWIVEIYDSKDKLKDYFVIDSTTRQQAESKCLSHPSMTFLLYPQSFVLFPYDNKSQCATMVKYLKANKVEHVDKFRGRMLPDNETDRLKLAAEVYIAQKPKFSSKDWK